MNANSDYNCAEQVNDKPENRSDNWCVYQLDRGKLAKRCFFTGVSDRKPCYMFGMPSGGSSKTHKDLDETATKEDRNEEGVEGLKKMHPIVHDNVKISPERYENTFDHLFRGSQELDLECSQHNSLESNIGVTGQRMLMQHPRRILENAQAKDRIQEAMGQVQAVESVPTVQRSYDGTKSQVFSANRTDQFIDRKMKRMVHRNMQESTFWKTCFRAQKVESGTLIDSDKNDFHKPTDSYKCVTKPYNTQSSTSVHKECTEASLEKWKHNSYHNALSGDGWTIMGMNPPDNLSVLAGKVSMDSVVDPTEGKSTKILKELEKARFKAENENKLKPYNQQGLKRSECSWYRQIKFVKPSENELD